ncbi:CooT family nickel-binding protein [bacterium]|nr:CooT family nickel-binding protein [bacterium]
MCLANVYQNTRTGEPVMNCVAYLRVDGNQVVAETLMGESQIVQGRITQIDFMNSDVIVEEIAPKRKEA